MLAGLMLYDTGDRVIEDLPKAIKDADRVKIRQLCLDEIEPRDAANGRKGPDATVFPEDATPDMPEANKGCCGCKRNFHETFQTSGTNTRTCCMEVLLELMEGDGSKVDPGHTLECHAITIMAALVDVGEFTAALVGCIDHELAERI